MTDTEKLNALVDYIRDAERYHLRLAIRGISSSGDKTLAIQDIISFIENELDIECPQLPIEADHIKE